MLIETQARKHEQTYSDEHRKLLGTHYTPDPIVDYIVQRSLRPFLEVADCLEDIRVLDPACGSGLFLLKAFDLLAQQWRSTFGSFGPQEAKHILANSLHGIDIDKRAISATRKHLLEKASLSETDVPQLVDNIIVDDSLSLKPSFSQLGLADLSTDETKVSFAFAKHSFHAVIGNPPYVRIQNTSLNKRDRYASTYVTASGRFDISSLFVELSEYFLKEQGRLGFIVSNKILSTSGARKLRAFLLTHFSIEEIVDLSDTKLFEAAVLPMILVATRTQNNGGHIAYSSITESHSRVATAVQSDNLLGSVSTSQIPFEANIEFANRVFQVQRFYSNPPTAKANVWTFHNERENRLLTKLRLNSSQTLNDVSEKISVGLKTTADSVFIKPMTKHFIIQKGFEPELIFPLLESHNIDRWRCSWDPERDLSVLYPHTEENGKVVPIDLEAYPKAKKYLESNRPQLQARTYLAESDRRWFEIWVHQSPSDFRQRKLITPDISTHNRFAIDDNALFVNGTCFYIILKDKSDNSYLSILGLLNSKVIEYFHKTTSGNSLYAKRFRYWSSYLRSYPIAKRLSNSHELKDAIVTNVSRLLRSNGDEERSLLEKENDHLCYRLFDLTDEDIEEIETTLSIHSSRSPQKGNSLK
jgi:adenine-specific DNA-methyltransferase